MRKSALIALLFLLPAPAMAEDTLRCNCDSPDLLYEATKDGKCFERRCASSDESGALCERTNNEWGLWSAKIVDPSKCGLQQAEKKKEKPSFLFEFYCRAACEREPQYAKLADGLKKSCVPAGTANPQQYWTETCKELLTLTPSGKRSAKDSEQKMGNRDAEAQRLLK